MLWAKAIEVDSVSCAIDFGKKLAGIILDKLLIPSGGVPAIALTLKYSLSQKGEVRFGVRA